MPNREQERTKYGTKEVKSKMYEVVKDDKGKVKIVSTKTAATPVQRTATIAHSTKLKHHSLGAKGKIAIATVVGASIVAGAVVPTMMLIKNVNPNLDTDIIKSELEELVDKIVVGVKPKEQASLSMWQLNKMVQEIAIGDKLDVETGQIVRSEEKGWRSFKQSEFEDIKRKLDLTEIYVPIDDVSTPEEYSFFYRLEDKAAPAPTAQYASDVNAYIQKEYNLKVMIRRTYEDLNTGKTIIKESNSSGVSIFSVDTYLHVANPEVIITQKVNDFFSTLDQWSEKELDALKLADPAKYAKVYSSLKIENLERNVTGDTWTEIISDWNDASTTNMNQEEMFNAQVEKMESLGFKNPTSALEKLRMNETNGVRAKIKYKFKNLSKDIGEKARYSLFVHVSFPSNNSFNDSLSFDDTNTKRFIVSVDKVEPGLISQADLNNALNSVNREINRDILKTLSVAELAALATIDSTTNVATWKELDKETFALDNGGGSITTATESKYSAGEILARGFSATGLQRRLRLLSEHITIEYMFVHERRIPEELKQTGTVADAPAFVSRSNGGPEGVWPEYGDDIEGEARYYLFLRATATSLNRTSIQSVVKNRNNIKSYDLIVGDATNQAKLDIFVSNVATAIVPSRITESMTIAALDAQVRKSYILVRDVSVFTNFGFNFSDALEDAYYFKPADVDLYYKFEKSASEAGEKARYTLSLKGVTNGSGAKLDSIAILNGNKEVQSFDNVSAQNNATTSDELRAIVDQLHSSIRYEKSTTNTIEELEKHVRTSFGRLYTSSTLEQIGFSNVTIPQLPSDVYIWYKFIRNATQAGAKATYSLYLQGTTKGINQTYPLSHQRKSMTISSSDVVQAPQAPTNQQTLNDFIENEIVGTPPRNLTIEQLDKQISYIANGRNADTWYQFSSDVFHVLGFENSSVGQKPADVHLEFKFELGENGKVDGEFVTYKLFIRGVTFENLKSEKEYDVVSVDEYIRPLSQEELDEYMGDMDFTVPTDLSWTELEELTTYEKNAQGKDEVVKKILTDFIINQLRLLDTPESLYPTFWPKDLSIKYTFTRKHFVNGEIGVYEFQLFGNSKGSDANAASKVFELTSTDIVDKPTTQAELEDYIKNQITYTLPETTIANLESIFNDKENLEKRVFNKTAMEYLGFTNVVFPEQNADVFMEFIIQRDSANGLLVPNARNVYRVVITAWTSAMQEANLKFEHRILITSTDVFTKPTDQADLTKYINGIIGSAPVNLTVVQLNRLIRENPTLFNQDVFTNVLGFRNTNFTDSAKPIDVNLSYTFTHEERTDLDVGKRVTYTLTVTGRAVTTGGAIFHSKNFIVTSQNNYTLPLTDATLAQFITALDVSVIRPKTMTQIDAFLAKSAPLTAQVINGLGLASTAPTIWPPDVMVTYQLVKGPIALAGAKQEYIFTVYGDVPGCTQAKKTVGAESGHLSSDVQSADGALVASELEKFFNVYGFEYEEKTMTSVPTQGVVNLAAIVSPASIPAWGYSSVTKSFAIKSIGQIFDAPANLILVATFTKGAVTETHEVFIDYVLVSQALKTADANRRVTAVVNALNALNNTTSHNPFELFTSPEANKDTYTFNLGVEAIEVMEDVDFVRFSLEHQEHDYSVIVIAEIITEHMSTPNPRIVTFTLYAFDRDLQLADAKMRAAKDSIQIFLPDALSTRTWAQLDATFLATPVLNKDNYDTLLGLTALESVKRLTSATFTLGRSQTENHLRIVLVLHEAGTTWDSFESTFTFELESSDNKQLVSDREIRETKEYLLSFDGAISTRFWTQLETTSVANLNNFGTQFGLDYDPDLVPVGLIAFTATNGTGAKDKYKIITGVITHNHSSMDEDARTITIEILSADLPMQIANDKINAAIAALNSYVASPTVLPNNAKVIRSIKNWEDLKKASTMSKERFAESLGIMDKDAVKAVANVTILAVQSPYDFIRKVTFTLNEEHTNISESTRKIDLYIESADRQQLIIAGVGTKIEAAKRDLASLAGISSRTWDLLGGSAGNVTADKNNYASVLGVESKPSIYQMDEVTFTTANKANTTYTKVVTAVITMANAPANTNMTVQFDIQASDKLMHDANLRANAAYEDLIKYNNYGEGKRYLVSSLDWAQFSTVSVANKSNYFTLLGITEYTSFTHLNTLTFVVEDVEGTNNMFMKRVKWQIGMNGNSLAANKLSGEFLLGAKDKVKLDSDEVNRETIRLLNAAKAALGLQTGKVSTINMEGLLLLVGNDTITAADFDTKLGITVGATLKADVAAIASVVFDVAEAADPVTNTLTITATLTHGEGDGEEEVTIAFDIYASDKVQLDANAVVINAMDFLRDLQLTNDEIEEADLVAYTSSLNWADMEQFTNADKTNYFDRLGIPSSEDMTNPLVIVDVEINANADNYLYTRDLIFVIDATGNDIPVENRTFKFTIRANNRIALIRAAADAEVQAVINEFASLNNTYSQNTWAELTDSSVTPESLDKSNYNTTLGLRDNPAVLVVDEIEFTSIVQNIVGTNTFSITISGNIVHANVNDNFVTTFSFRIIAQDKHTLDAKFMLSEIEKEMKTVETESSLHWYDGNPAGLSKASTTLITLDNYAAVLGIATKNSITRLKEGYNGLRGTIDFDIKAIPAEETPEAGKEYEHMFTWDIEVTFTVEDESYTLSNWILEAEDKDELIANLVGDGWNRDVYNVLTLIETIKSSQSTINWSALSLLRQSELTHDNLAEKLGITITPTSEQLASLLEVVKVAGIDFIPTESLNTSFSIDVEVVIKKGWAIGNEPAEGTVTTTFNVKAADKVQLDAAELMRASKEILQGLDNTVSLFTWVRLDTEYHANVLNYASRLGIVSNAVLNELDHMDFTWEASQRDTYTMIVTVTFKESTGQSELSETLTFELIAFDKEYLDFRDANNLVNNAKNALHALNFEVSDSTWAQMKDVNSGTLTTLDNEWGMDIDDALKILIDAGATINFTAENIEVPGPEVGRMAHQKRITATIIYDKSSMTGALLVVQFTITASNKVELDANYIITKASEELSAIITNGEVVTSKYSWNRISNVASANKYNFIDLLGIVTTAPTKFIRELTALNIELTTTQAGDKYRKDVVVRIVMNNATVTVPDTNFVLIGSDTSATEAADRINQILIALPFYNDVVSSLNWNVLSTRLSTFEATTYAAGYGVAENATIVNLNNTSFRVVGTPGTYTIRVRATIDEPDADPGLQRTYEFNIQAKDKPLQDANDRVRRAMTAVNAIIAKGVSTHRWSGLMNASYTNKDQYETVLGVTVDQAIKDVEFADFEIERLENDAEDDTSGGQFATQARKYKIRVFGSVNEMITDIPFEQRSFDFEFAAANKTTLDANDQVERTMRALNTLENDSTLNWLSLSASSTATKDNYASRLGISNIEEIGRTHGVAFAMTNVNATNDDSHFAGDKYQRRVVATISQPGTDISSLTREWIITPTDKMFRDIQDRLTREQKRMISTPTKTTTWSNRTIRIVTEKNFASFTNTSNYGAWINDATYYNGSEKVDETATTFTLKSRDVANGRVVITSTITSVNPDNDFINVPAITQDWTLQGFLTPNTVVTEALAQVSLAQTTGFNAQIVSYTRGSLPASSGNYGGLFGITTPAKITEHITHNDLGFSGFTYEEQDATWYPGWYRATANFTQSLATNTKTKYLYVRSSDSWRLRGDKVMDTISSSSGSYVGNRAWFSTTIYTGYSVANMLGSGDTWYGRDRYSWVWSNIRHSYIQNTLDLDSRINLQMAVLWNGAPSKRAALIYKASHPDSSKTWNWGAGLSGTDYNNNRWVMFSM